MSLPFHIVDVFARAPYTGNQLAVVLDAGRLSTERMQLIANEMNYAETTFVTRELVDGGYPVRIFTPVEELPFAGHPTLGTAWVLRRDPDTGRPERVNLNLAVGQVPVTFESDERGDENAWMEAPPAEFATEIDCEAAAAALGIDVSDIEDRGPIQQIRMGLSVLIVPLRSLDALRRARLDLAAFESIADRGVGPFVHLFCPETIAPENDLCARFFFDAHGVREDSATGSATACLGAYLLRYGYYPAPISLRVEQGYEIERPSLLLLRADGSLQAPMVSVGGAVFETARGTVLG